MMKDMIRGELSQLLKIQYNEFFNDIHIVDDNLLIVNKNGVEVSTHKKIKEFFLIEEKISKYGEYLSINFESEQINILFK